jgi:hypothetical protein
VTVSKRAGTIGAGQESALTPQRFAAGMTFAQYVNYVGTPENLAREAGWGLGPKRADFSGLLGDAYRRAALSQAQAAAVRWLTAQPDGPAKMLVISEEWSSDCRRDVPLLARLAEAGEMELRIFPRDGQAVGRGPRANPADSPNADIVNEFLNEKDGRTWQSIPIAVFYTRDLRYLYHYTEFPAIYHKERITAAMRAAAAGETLEQARDQFLRAWRALQHSPFFPLWASAAIDEILSALHERLVVGAPAPPRGDSAH